jgi:hypothetical protein
MFGKKKAMKKMMRTTQDQNGVIQSSLKKIKALNIKFEGQPAIVEALNGLYNQYGNMTANGKPESIKADEQISSALSDIELCVKKSEKSGDLTEIESLIKKIKILIAER